MVAAARVGDAPGEDKANDNGSGAVPRWNSLPQVLRFGLRSLLIRLFS